MNVFRYAEDYYGGWLAEQLLLPAVLVLFLLVALFAGMHLVRRSGGAPVSTDPIPPESLGSGSLLKYAVGARLYHWANFVLLAALIVSGVALFEPASLKPVVLSWLRAHEIFAALFAAGLILHILIAPRHGDGRAMWFDQRDWRDLKLILANFIGRTTLYPAFGKYDPFQKLYHAFITLASAIVIATGIVLVLSAEAWATFSHDTLRWVRLFHDLGASAFAAAVLGHIYFGLIRVNWPELNAMFTGRISAPRFRLYHSAGRWRPKHRVQAAADANGPQPAGRHAGECDA